MAQTARVAAPHSDVATVSMVPANRDGELDVAERGAGSSRASRRAAD
eukprot:CAMPEP_0180048308 /NCGR_PEP_ID=MMETSP0984-20121128/38237_1 /TAXON_ID=483367 /ORGANISM="non described non described, Strain CCMP 2436" /LENGTH=46 /DNA_ID= /DNA_START= /DNA_END= /DNA_ORIENTATION=